MPRPFIQACCRKTACAMESCTAALQTRAARLCSPPCTRVRRAARRTACIPLLTVLFNFAPILCGTHPAAFGLTVIEAMTCGLPSFVTCKGGPSEIVKHKRSGMMSPCFYSQPFSAP